MSRVEQLSRWSRSIKLESQAGNTIDVYVPPVTPVVKGAGTATYEQADRIVIRQIHLEASPATASRLVLISQNDDGAGVGVVTFDVMSFLLPTGLSVHAPVLPDGIPLPCRENYGPTAPRAFKLQLECRTLAGALSSFGTQFTAAAPGFMVISGILIPAQSGGWKTYNGA